MDQAPAFVEALARIEQLTQARLEEQDQYWQKLLEWQVKVCLSTLERAQCDMCKFFMNRRYLQACWCARRQLVCYPCSANIPTWMRETDGTFQCTECGDSGILREIPPPPTKPWSN